MIIAVRCFSCGNVIGDKCEQYLIYTHKYSPRESLCKLRFYRKLLQKNDTDTYRFTGLRKKTLSQIILHIISSSSVISNRQPYFATFYNERQDRIDVSFRYFFGYKLCFLQIDCKARLDVQWRIYLFSDKINLRRYLFYRRIIYLFIH